jgi:hypothetical protein
MCSSIMFVRYDVIQIIRLIVRVYRFHENDIHMGDTWAFDADVFITSVCINHIFSCYF